MSISDRAATYRVSLCMKRQGESTAFQLSALPAFRVCQRTLCVHCGVYALPAPDHTCSRVAVVHFTNNAFAIKCTRVHRSYGSTSVASTPFLLYSTQFSSARAFTDYLKQAFWTLRREGGNTFPDRVTEEILRYRKKDIVLSFYFRPRAMRNISSKGCRIVRSVEYTLPFSLPEYKVRVLPTTPCDESATVYNIYNIYNIYGICICI